MGAFRPFLPPKAGYIEVEADGARQYQRIESEDADRLAALEAQSLDNTEMMVDQDYRIMCIELNITDA